MALLMLDLITKAINSIENTGSNLWGGVKTALFCYFIVINEYQTI
jgi:hypothetical protein